MDKERGMMKEGKDKSEGKVGNHRVNGEGRKITEQCHKYHKQRAATVNSC